VLSEPTTKSIAVPSPFAVAVGSRLKSGKVPSWSERAACIAPNAEKFDNQKPRAASLLFVRHGTQSYDEIIATVPRSASPEHDVRDDQHVRYFLDWRKRQVNVPRLLAGNLSANAGDSSNDSAQDGQLASGRSDASLCRPGNRSGRIANFGRHLGSMGEGWSPAPTVQHVPFGHSPLALGRRRP